MTTRLVASPRFTFGRSHRGRSSPGRSYLALVLLAVAMVALYALISALPLARSFFDLEPLPIADAIGLALLAGAWALALTFLRRLDLARRWAVFRAALRTSTAAWRLRRSSRKSTGSADARSSGHRRG
jgi:hypothetical protein